MQEKKIQNMVGFNGYFGCFYCKIKGEYVQEKKHVYFPSSPNALERISSELPSLFQNNLFGVKGKPSFWNLQLKLGVQFFDVYSNFTIDAMHSIFLGITLKITDMWFSNSVMDKEYGLRQKIEHCDKIILEIQNQVPREITRSVRIIGTRNNWKADEWKYWLFYWSPIILSNTLPDKFYTTWILLVKAVRILCQYSISVSDYSDATLYLQQFIYEYEQQYGKGNMVYNMHMLNHLPTCVKKWGPLWVYWCFPFEKALGFYSQFVFSTKNPALSFCLSSQLCQVYAQISSMSIIQKKNLYKLRSVSVQLTSKQIKLDDNDFPSYITNSESTQLFSTKSIILTMPNNNIIVLCTYSSSQRDSSCLVFKSGNQKKFGKITSILICYSGDVLNEIYITLQSYDIQQTNFYNNLFPTFYKDQYSEVCITVDQICGRSFFVSSEHIPQHNQKTVLAGIEITL